MSEKVKIYNEEHMNALVTKYESAVNEIDEIVNNLSSSSGAKQILSDNYEGQGKEIVEDLFTKIKEHLLYLQTCCVSTSEYIKISVDTMNEQEQLLTKNFKGIIM